MADYFSEYSSFIGAKGLPSPADTPYDTPGFLRSKRSSRATTAGSTRSREQSGSPPPLPPDATDYADKSREGRYSALDPRRFTPTLHANLVSEILSLRRELDSKNNLVENLETTLATAKTDNDQLSDQLSQSAREVRSAKQQVAQMESGTLEALDAMGKERDAAKTVAQDLKSKLESFQKQTRRQDEDAVRTQSIWEREKDQWESERRQLERRVHVTETRLRTVVDEMATQQAAADARIASNEELPDEEGTFKDSGCGNDSDTASVTSKTGKHHKRNMSSFSFRSRNGFRHSSSTRAIETPEPYAKPGHSLADELGIDEEDEYDMDDFEHGEDELDYPGRVRQTMESRQGSVAGDADSKAMRVLGLADEVALQSPVTRDVPKDVLESDTTQPPVEEVANSEPVPPTPKVEYVDTGYQPSPPTSPPKRKSSADAPVERQLEIPAPTPKVTVESYDDTDGQDRVRHAITVAARMAASPISPPETPVVDGEVWPERDQKSVVAPSYSDCSTQTDIAEAPAAPASQPEPSKRDSLQPPPAVPQIAIIPPTSRPGTPRAYVLPPGTKNASAQAELPWPGVDAAVQTEGIQIDRRPVKLPPHLLPTFLNTDPVPSVPKMVPHPPAKSRKRESSAGTAKIFTNIPAAASLPSPPMQSPTEAGSFSSHSRNGSSKDLGKMPLKAIPLPKPTLAPAVSLAEVANTKPQGPLNRSSQFGVSQGNRHSRQLAEMEDESEDSEKDDDEAVDIAGSMPALNRGIANFSSRDRFRGASNGKAPSRPGTADSFDAAPAPSVASSRAESHRAGPSRRPPPKMNAYLNTRSRSPSFNSVASSTFSTQSALPPYAIPTRTSSRVPLSAHGDGPYSPTPGGHVRGSSISKRGGHTRQGSLRKAQSATALRGSGQRRSPQKTRRRRRSPDLTPVQSMAFDSPGSTSFPIPELPTPLQQSLAFDWGNARPSTSSRPPGTADGSLPPTEESGLVDSIAATMVGEWMWKYIRKRKSFGGAEAVGDFASQVGEDCGVSFNSSAHGTRHKRWVWLSPYERTIMWDSKQPTSGTALLGKKGRKLAIQSVLDVADDTPVPKRAELPAAYHRSILILTPSRALKFTTTNAERHALWMSALAFLAESDRMQNQLPPLPLVPPIPAMPQNPTSMKRNRSPSMGRANVRDSLTLSKGKQPHLLRSTSEQHQATNGLDTESVPADDQGADFPCIPRLYSSTTRHQRKRSNTSPRLAPPFTNLRSFSSTAVPSTSSSQPYNRSYGSSSKPSASASSQSGSRRESITSPDRPNFFEAVGTVRMEAFVDPALKNGVLYVPPPPPPTQQSPRRRRGNSNLSASSVDKRRAGYVFDENGIDPFKGF